MGYRCSIEQFDGKTLMSRTTADRIYYDSLENWHLENYTERTFTGMRESLERGERKVYISQLSVKTLGRRELKSL